MTAIDTSEISVVEGDPVVPDVTGEEAQSAKAIKPKQREPLPPGTMTLLWTLLTIGLLAIWVVSYAVLFSDIQQTAQQRQLYADFREQLAQGDGGLAVAPIGGTIDLGAPVAVMKAPTLGLDNEIVVEGTASSQTKLGPGHRPDTALPGQEGVSVLYGRGVTFGAPFARLGQQVEGSVITLTTGQGTFEYQVDDVRRAGDPVPAPVEAGESRLILVSVDSGGALRGLTADSTVFLDASLVGKTVAAPPGRPTAIAPNQEVMAIDKTALVPLVFWLQGLLIAAVLLVWARVRWGNWQTWVVAVPVILALLWGTTSSAFTLLPNLL